MAKSVPFSTHATSSFRTMPDMTLKPNTFHVNINNKITLKEQTDFSFGKKQKAHIAHYTRYVRRRLRRSYQESLDQNDNGYKNSVNNDEANTEETNTNDYPSASSNIIKDDVTSSTFSINGPTTLDGLSSKNEFSSNKFSTKCGDDVIIVKPNQKANSKIHQNDEMNRHDNESGFQVDTWPEEMKSSSNLDFPVTRSPDPQGTEIPNEESNISGIVVVSIISIILSSSIFASNLLVMIPFNRCTRIRTTPSNFLLLVLSISDFIVGIVVIPLVTITTILRYLKFILAQRILMTAKKLAFLKL